MHTTQRPHTGFGLCVGPTAVSGCPPAPGNCPFFSPPRFSGAARPPSRGAVFIICALLRARCARLPAASSPGVARCTSVHRLLSSPARRLLAQALHACAGSGGSATVRRAPRLLSYAPHMMARASGTVAAPARFAHRSPLRFAGSLQGLHPPRPALPAAGPLAPLPSPPPGEPFCQGPRRPLY